MDLPRVKIKRLVKVKRWGGRRKTLNHNTNWDAVGVQTRRPSRVKLKLLVKVKWLSNVKLLKGEGEQVIKDSTVGILANTT